MVIKKKHLSASSIFSFCIQICPLQAPMIIIFVNFLFLVFFFLNYYYFFSCFLVLLCQVPIWLGFAVI